MFDYTADIVHLLTTTTAAVMPFLLMFLITLIATGSSMFILAMNEGGDREVQQLDTYFSGILLSYKYSLGEYSDFEYGSQFTELKLTFWIINTVVVAVIMLNMLIAVMGEAFGEALAFKAPIKYKAKAELICYNIHL